MKSLSLSVIVGTITLIMISGCKPDKLEVEIYSSDLKKAAASVVEIPVTATFSMMGDDKDGALPKASAVCKQYLNENAEFKISKGSWGDNMVVKFNIPMGTTTALNSYLKTNHRPLAIVVAGSKVKLIETPHLKRINAELTEINMMLGLKMPSKSTIISLVGDEAEPTSIQAISVFVDKKPELVFSKKIARRESTKIEYKGGDDSVYSQVPIQFYLK